MLPELNLPAIGATLAPFVGALPGSLITRTEVKGWYRHIKKPEWRPPNWAFGPVWSSLYASMGYASYLVYRDGGGFSGAAVPLALYGSQLALNWAWTPVFFGQHNVKGGFYLICALWVNVAACGLSFYGVNKTAGYLMAPYLAWLSLATMLNYSIWKMNGDRPSPKEE
ncbi:translocator protein [Eurytemora carolleeae]|uniref:translocator protein n=1 Tax=Eurytemora carolleeae TaxID=1294199 RepID=UPI000C77CC1D|nr:translocator protein [Eurytemora carolleeae]|eukprot:XP_023345705.1 translocator protein-like [Eurytemora affinis]